MQMKKQYDDERKAQEELAEKHQDVVGRAEDKKLASKIQTTFYCPSSKAALEGIGFTVRTYLVDIHPDLGKVPMSCMKFEVSTQWKHLFKEFILELGWANVLGKWALYAKMAACVPIELIFGLPERISISLCAGGSIEFRLWSDCPQVKGVSMTGGAWLSITGSVKFWYELVSFDVTLKVGVEVGMDWFGEFETECLTEKEEGNRRRRKYTRRRLKTTCTRIQDCDEYVKGYFKTIVAVNFFGIEIDATVSLEMKYWTKKKNIEYFIKFGTNYDPTGYAGYYEIYSACLYRQQLYDY